MTGEQRLAVEYMRKLGYSARARQQTKGGHLLVTIRRRLRRGYMTLSVTPTGVWRSTEYVDQTGAREGRTA